VTLALSENVVHAYSQMSASVERANYEKFIRPMNIKKHSLLEAVPRDTGRPKEQPRDK
jgi:hypothetical protein